MTSRRRPSPALSPPFSLVLDLLLLLLLVTFVCARVFFCFDPCFFVLFACFVSTFVLSFLFCIAVINQNCHKLQFKVESMFFNLGKSKDMLSPFSLSSRLGWHDGENNQKILKIL